MLSRTLRRSCLRAATTVKHANVSARTVSMVANAPRTTAAAPSVWSSMVVPRRFASQTVKVPEMAESITEGTLSAWNKEVGEYVARDELLATIETDKIDVEVNAPVGGTVTELLVSAEDTVEVGQEIAKIEEGDAPEGGAAPKETPKEEAPKDEAPAKEAPKQESAPAKEEPKAAAPAPKSAPKSAPKEESKAPAASFSRGEERVKMNRMRLRIAERLKESQNTHASLTTFNEIDMSKIMAFRKKYKDEFLDKTGIKLGFMGPFAKAVCLAAKENPAINAAIENDDTLVFRDYVDISVAVATPKGLVTPVIRNAESRSILGIEAEIAALGKKARDGKLALEDMAGGTFTISNGGVFGSLFGTPIINGEQTAVLGMHGTFNKPVVKKDGTIGAAPVMVIALTYDHKVVDGREAVTFLKTVKELIEDPEKMLLLDN
ncbi:dihydrolipoyllysine-residue succinyltransferase component of 2-oxoglutarate dehydrogenase complex, mitochondrial [Diutina catenulata]